MRLNEIGAHWSQIESRLLEQKVDLFGDTPMKRGMETVKDRFRREFHDFAGMPRSALIVVSDGVSTDGSPVAECEAVQRLGTTVVGVYLTSSHVAEPKRLHEHQVDEWPDGAKTLFEMTSLLGEDGAALAVLQAKGWNVTFKSRLFIQINESQVMAEFMEAILEVEAQVRSQYGNA